MTEHTYRTTTERIEAVFKVFGWEVKEDFVRRYHSDVLIYSLTNALVTMSELTDKLAGELAQHGWGDMHYGHDMPQEQKIVELLDEWRERGKIPWGPEHPDYDEMGQ